MMKRLLVLMLVLGISSSANAGMLDLVIVSHGPGPDPVTTFIPPTKEITLQPSEWIDLDVIYTPYTDEGPLFQLNIQILVDGPGIIDLSQLTEPPGAWDAMFSPGVVGPDSMSFNWGFSGSGVADGVAIDHILFHCDDWPDVIITMVDFIYGNLGSLDTPPGGATPDYGDPVVVHQYPEPMTIALLGLGGLALLRKRRAF
jgi:hypothetical protein